MRMREHAIGPRVVLLSRLAAKDEDAARGLANELAKLERSVPSEPGSLSYAVMTVEDEPLVFFITESWATRTEAEAHEARAASGDVAERAAPLLAGPIQTHHLHPLHTAHPQDQEGTT